MITYKVKNISLILSFIFISSAAFSQHIADADIKTNVQPITSSLQKILQLQPSSFEFNTQKYKYLQLAQGRRYGFMADNVQAVFPEIITQKKVQYMFGKNAFRSASVNAVDETALVPVLVAAVKELQQQIDELKATVEELKKRK